MKKAKKISIIVIGVLLLIGLMAVIFVYDPDNMVFGNNLRSSAFSWGFFGGEEYKSIEEAMPKVAEELGDNYECEKNIWCSSGVGSIGYPRS